MSPVNPEALAPLDRALIAALGLDLASIQAIEPVSGGLGGGRLLRLLVAHKTGEATWREWLVMKTLLPGDGWLGAASGDFRLREIQLWKRGLLQSLPAGVATGAREWTLLGDPQYPTAGALLMDDLTSYLLRTPYHPPPGRLPSSVVALLQRLAALHARYWQDARLSDPALGLMSPREALLLISQDTVRARIAMGDTNPYLPLAEYGWDAFFRLAPPPVVERLREVLAHPEPIVRAITSLPQTLVHGDVWGPNLGWLPPTDSAPRRERRLLLLDWALALSGPATYDPLWLCGGWHALDPRRVLAYYRMFLERHLRSRGASLSRATWLALVDAGCLRTVGACGEAFGRAATEAPAGRVRLVAEARVRWWAGRAVQAADRLLGNEQSNRKK
jgi:phosphotransferase family enzyme